MDQQTAHEEARRRNVELGHQGKTDGYFVEVEQEPERWTVQRRKVKPERRSWPARIWDVLLSYPFP